MKDELECHAPLAVEETLSQSIKGADALAQALPWPPMLTKRNEQSSLLMD